MGEMRNLLFSSFLFLLFVCGSLTQFLSQDQQQRYGPQQQQQQQGVSPGNLLGNEEVFEPPYFTQEPPERVDYLNTEGLTIPCEGRGNPEPEIRWEGPEQSQNSFLTNIPKLRNILPNGTLILYPFSPETYRMDIHTTSYHCRLINSVGTLRSRNVHIRAVVAQPWSVKIRTYPAELYRTSIRSSILLKCRIDHFGIDIIEVIGWRKNGDLKFIPRLRPGKRDRVSELMLPNGDLLIIDQNKIRSPLVEHPAIVEGSKFVCITRHKLTKEEIESSPYPLSSIPDGPKKENNSHTGTTESSIKLINNPHFANVLLVTEGDPIILHCISEPPVILPLSSSTLSVRWEKFTGNSWIKVGFNKPYRELGDSLMIERSIREHSGHYRCLFEEKSISAYPDRSESEVNYRSVSGVSISSTSRSSSIEFQVRVVEPLKIKASINPKKVQIGGQSAEITCTIYPSTDVEISWFKDGNPIQGAGRVRLFSSTVLQISQVKIDDQGIYQCIAWPRNDPFRSQSASVLLEFADSAPKLVYGFIDQTLMPGPTVSLKCITSGYPMPKTYWQIDGFRLSPDPRILIGDHISQGDLISSLNFTLTQTHDGGLYSCVVSNRAGTIIHSARLNIYGEPWIRIVPSVVAVTGDNNFQIQCPVAGYPISSISWIRDGMKLPQDARQKVFSNGTLHLTIVEKRDSGIYTCQAKDTQGRSAKREITIVTVAPLKITPFPEKSKVIEGDRVTLVCALSSGDPPIELKWNIFPFPVTGQKSYTISSTDDFTSILSIAGVQEADAKIYQCTARNSISSISRSNTLTVLVSPIIEPFSFQDDLREGTMTRIICGVSQGDLPLKFIWTKDDVHLLTSNSLPHMEISNLDAFSTILKISKLAEIHSGVYNCLVSSSHPFSKTNFSSRLIVQVGPKFVQEPQDLNVLHGNEAFFNCQGHGVPLPTVQWFYKPISEAENSEIKWRSIETIWPSSNFQIYSNGSLLIFDAQENFDGHMMCKLDNGIGSAQTKSARLYVQVPPYFLSTLESQTVSQGKNHEISCSAVGDVPIEISWIKGKTTFVNVAANRIHTIIEFNGKKVKATLVIKNVNENDAGLYECTATNNLGKIAQTYNLFIEVKPGVPKNFRVISTESTRILLEWLPPEPTFGENGKSPIVSYIVEYRVNNERNFGSEKKEVPGDVNQILIENLSPATFYSFQIFAINSAGNGDPSKELIMRTSSLPPYTSPQNIELKPEPRRMWIKWEPISEEMANGNILAYAVSMQNLMSGQTVEHVLPITAVLFNSHEVHGFDRNSSSSPGITDHNQGQEHLQKYHRDKLYYQKEFCCETIFGNLIPFTQYVVKIKGLNIVGDGPYTQDFIGKTLDDYPEGPSRNFNCMQISSKSLQLSWKPPDSPNGPILSYLVVYYPLDNASNTVGKNETRQTYTSKAILENLEPNTNYTFTIYSANSASQLGSEWLFGFCKTLEDYPEPPVNLQVYANSENSVILNWVEPKKSNGILSHYTVYIKIFEKNKEAFEIKRTVQTSVESFTETGLDLTQHKYIFWMSASNRVGESRVSSPQVTVTPPLHIETRLIGQSGIKKVNLGETLKLHCKIIGLTTPASGGFISGTIGENIRVLWQKNGKNIAFDTNTYASTNPSTGDSDLNIFSAKKSDGGNFTCVLQVNNKIKSSRKNDEVFSKNSNKINFIVHVQAPLPIPNIRISFQNLKLEIFWADSKFELNSQEPLGYVLYHRIQGSNSDWKRTIFPYYVKNYTFHGLDCGSTISFYMISFNQNSQSEDSQLKKIHISGPIRLLPPASQFMTINITSVRINLFSLNENSSFCKTNYFSIKYREMGNSKSWTGVKEDRIPFQNEYLLDGLRDAFSYEILLNQYTAFGSSPTTSTFQITTLNLFGEMPLIDVISKNMVTDFYSPIIYTNLMLIVPILVACLAVLVAIMSVYFYLKRRRRVNQNHIPSLPGHGPYGSGPPGQIPPLYEFHHSGKDDPMEQLYSTIPYQPGPVPPSYHGLVSQQHQHQGIPDISPYATFQLSDSKKYHHHHENEFFDISNKIHHNQNTYGHWPQQNQPHQIHHQLVQQQQQLLPLHPLVVDSLESESDDGINQRYFVIPSSRGNSTVISNRSSSRSSSGGGHHSNSNRSHNKNSRGSNKSNQKNNFILNNTTTTNTTSSSIKKIEIDSEDFGCGSSSTSNEPSPRNTMSRKEKKVRRKESLKTTQSAGNNFGEMIEESMIRDRSKKPGPGGDYSIAV